MNTTLYTHRYHGKIVRTPDGRKVATHVLLREQRGAVESARLAGMVGKVIAGRVDASGLYWVGTVLKALKKDGGSLVVVTRGGTKLTVKGGGETTFAAWDLAFNDPENASQNFQAII